MLTCKEMTELVTDYLEDRLPWDRSLRFRLHLGMCWKCRTYLRQMKQTIKTLGRLPPEPISEEVRDQLLKRFRKWKR